MPYGQDQTVSGGYGQDQEAISTAAPGILTDDATIWAGDQPAGQPNMHVPGLIERAGNFVAHPIQSIQNAWKYPGSYLADATRAQGSAAMSALTLPGDVATGKVDVNDPGQAGSTAARSLGMAMLAGPVSPSAISRISAPPTTEDLFHQGGAGFDVWRNSGLEYNPADAAAWATQFKQGLNKSGILDVTAGAPSTHSILDAITNPPPGALPMSGGDLDSIRKAFVHTAQGSGANNTERLAAGRAKASFLDFLQNTPPSNAVAGAPAAPEVAGLRDAIGNYAAASRSDLLNNLEDNAELQAMRAHSGHAGGNPIRQNVASALRVNPTTGQSLLSRSGFNPDEVAAAQEVVAGTRPSNFVRTTSNLTGGGLGHAGAIGGILAAKEGYEAGGIPGAVLGGSLPYIGSTLRGVDQRMAANRLAAADELVRLRSPLAQQTGATAPVPFATRFPIPENRLIRALMLQQQGQQQSQ